VLFRSKVLEQITRHPLTDAGLDKFLADWAKGGKKAVARPKASARTKTIRPRAASAKKS